MKFSKLLTFGAGMSLCLNSLVQAFVSSPPVAANDVPKNLETVGKNIRRMGTIEPYLRSATCDDFSLRASLVSEIATEQQKEAATKTKTVPKIIIAGAPASGKGTQCEMLKEKYGLVHLSTGDMLREAVKQGTEVGKLAKKYMDEGALVPDDVIIGIVKDRLQSKDCVENGWLLDGFPRTEAQALALKAAGIEANSFILLNVPDETLIERAVGRRVDPVTGNIYHLTFNPPPEEIADRLEHRSDDTEEKMKNRLAAYHQNIDNVRDSFSDILTSIDGLQAKGNVFSSIVEIIDEQAEIQEGEEVSAPVPAVAPKVLLRPKFFEKRVDCPPQGKAETPRDFGPAPGTVVRPNYVQSRINHTPTAKAQPSRDLGPAPGTLLRPTYIASRINHIPTCKPEAPRNYGPAPGSVIRSKYVATRINHPPTAKAFPPRPLGPAPGTPLRPKYLAPRVDCSPEVKAAIYAEALPEGAISVETQPIEGMKPGTSGLRKKVSIISEGLYLHNFVQSIFDVLPAEELAGSTLLVSGDGRYYNREALQVIIKIAAANGVGRVWVGKGGLMSTPAASATLRTREGGAAYGGLVLTASHNPGGPEEDFGIKFNTANGAPATETLTDKIYERTLEIGRIKIMEETPDVDLDTIGTTNVGEMVVEVIDPAEDYLQVLRSQFNFEALKKLIARDDFDFVFDAMYGVAGAYAKKLFVEELGASEESLMRDEVKEDFGGDHPDPNLTYAKELVKKMGLSREGIAWPYTEMDWTPPQFGAASDGDADRNMILGHRFFVTPSDSVAIIAANDDAIPYFANNGGLKGVARSMPTSGALDRVAEEKGLKFFETPTGWKFFGNLMDSGLLGKEDYTPFLCGEESFGTGSDHIREKDGLWAVLAWMSILAKYNSDPSKPFVSVEDIVRSHWEKYGRNFYARYDYETVDLDAANEMMDYLRGLNINDGDEIDGFALAGIDEFEYTDPVDGSSVSKQGIRVMFKDGSRVVFRLSGTGSVGATIRVYIEKYEPNKEMHLYASQPYVKALAEAGLKLAKLQEFTGRENPTVIT